MVVDICTVYCVRWSDGYKYFATEKSSCLICKITLRFLVDLPAIRDSGLQGCFHVPSIASIALGTVQFYSLRICE